MFELIKDFIRKKFATLNSSFKSSLQVKEIQARIDADIPTSEKAIHYDLSIARISKNEDETGRYYFVEMNIQLYFLAAGKDREFYVRIFDDYIWELIGIIMMDTSTLYTPYKDDTISTDVINGIQQISVTNTNNFEDNLYKPTIEITFQVMRQ